MPRISAYFWVFNGINFLFKDTCVKYYYLHWYAYSSAVNVKEALFTN
jgi:hypothetical protein